AGKSACATAWAHPLLLLPRNCSTISGGQGFVSALAPQPTACLDTADFEKHSSSGTRVIMNKKATAMPGKSDSEMNINSWLEDDLYQQYRRAGGGGEESGRGVFEHGAPEGTGAAATSPAPAPAAPAGPAPSENLLPMRGVAARVAQNMDASLSMPLA